jgi:hypothetical protein
MSNSIDQFIEELKHKGAPEAPRDTEIDNLDDDTLQRFILKNAGRLIKDSVDAVETHKQTCATAEDPDEVAALAALISAASGAIETVNKLNLQNKKIKAAKEIKKMDIESREKIALEGPAGNNPLQIGNNNTTNIMVATREEIFKALLNNKGDARDIAVDAEIKRIEG